MSDERKLRLLRGLQQQQVAAALVGDCAANTRAAGEAHLAIGLAAGDALESAPWDVALLGSSIEPLPILFALARDHLRRIKRARDAVTAPNLLCVAGAFSFGLPGLAAVLISNFGTSVVYHNTRRSLRAAHSPVIQRREAGLDAGGHGGAGTAPARPKPSYGDRFAMETDHERRSA